MSLPFPIAKISLKVCAAQRDEIIGLDQIDKDQYGQCRTSLTQIKRRVTKSISQSQGQGTPTWIRFVCEAATLVMVSETIRRSK